MVAGVVGAVVDAPQAAAFDVAAVGALDHCSDGPTIGQLVDLAVAADYYDSRI